jgi:ankyrin repeat protein
MKIEGLASGSTALMMAAHNGHKEIIEYMLEVGIEDNLRNDEGLNAQEIAEKAGHTEIAKILKFYRCGSAQWMKRKN